MTIWVVLLSRRMSVVPLDEIDFALFWLVLLHARGQTRVTLCRTRRSRHKLLFGFERLESQRQCVKFSVF